MGMGQNPGTPGEPQNSWDLWMFIPLKMVLKLVLTHTHMTLDSYDFSSA